MNKYEIDAVMEELSRVSERVDTTVPSEYLLRCHEIVPSPYPNRMMTNPDRWSNAGMQSTYSSDLSVDFNNDPFIREMLRRGTRTVSTAQQIAAQDMATLEERVLSSMQSLIGSPNTEQTRHMLAERLRSELENDSRGILRATVDTDNVSMLSRIEIRDGDRYIRSGTDHTSGV
jgi:hypothetical protein